VSNRNFITSQHNQTEVNASMSYHFILNQIGTIILKVTMCKDEYSHCCSKRRRRFTRIKIAAVSFNKLSKYEESRLLKINTERPMQCSSCSVNKFHQNANVACEC
jgi:hypothetical protein